MSLPRFQIKDTFAKTQSEIDGLGMIYHTRFWLRAFAFAADEMFWLELVKMVQILIHPEPQTSV